MPRPRPVNAPATAAPPQPDAAGPAAKDEHAPAESAKAAPQPSACRLALTEAIAVAPSIAPIKGEGGCGGEDLVRLEQVVLEDGGKVALKPAATVRCEMASDLAQWVRTDLAALAAGLGGRLSELDNFDSYSCRGRNRVAGAKLSEHGRANALDVRGFKLADGRSISLTEPASPREVREKVLQSVCARFTTVLGPGSDGYHEDHIHLDRAERRGGYRICQWDVHDPMPQIAPLLPAVRPNDAPPREVAAVTPGDGTRGPSAANDARPDDEQQKDEHQRDGQEAAAPPASSPEETVTRTPLPVPAPPGAKSGDSSREKESGARVANSSAPPVQSQAVSAKSGSVRSGKPKRRQPRDTLPFPLSLIPR